MKKSLYLISGILIAGMLLFFFSCSKDEIKSENQNQPAQTTLEQQVFKAIKDFKQKVAYYEENSMYKSGETVNADSAMLLLEGTINFSHAFTSDLYNEFLAEDLTLVVPKNENGEVVIDVLVQKYLEMKADITTVYYNSSFENKGLVVVDLLETARDDDEITISVAVITGDRSNDPPPPDPQLGGPFEAGDNWWYGENEGKCYDTITTSDAAQELFAAMSQYIYDYNQSHGIATFFPVQTHYFMGGDKKALRRPNDVMDNHVDFYMYNAYDEYGISDDTLCVEWPEGNLYYQYLKYLLYNKMKDSLQSNNYWCYQPAQIIDMQGIYSQVDEHYFHYGYFLFGHPWYWDEGEGPEEL